MGKRKGGRKKHDCKACTHYLIYRDTMAYYESDKYLCALSNRLNCDFITKCSHFKLKSEIKKFI